MDLLKIASELFMSKLGAEGKGLDLGLIASALARLLGSNGNELNLADLVAKFNQGGLASLAQSWLGDGANDALSLEQIVSILGKPQISEFASQIGVSTESATSGLSEMIPELIDKYSSSGNLLESVGGAAGLLGAASKLFK